MLRRKKSNSLFGERRSNALFAKIISAKENTSLPFDDAPCDSDTAYCLRVGAEMPVEVMWTRDLVSWSECVTLTPPEISEYMSDGKLVYVRLNERTPATLILSCKTLARRSAYCIVAEAELARTRPQGGIITDENTAIYNLSEGEWVSVSTLARECSIPYFGAYLKAYRCESELYELQLAACVDVYLPGQLKYPHNLLALYEYLLLKGYDKISTFDHLPLRPTITTPIHTLSLAKSHYRWIGLIPLNDAESPTSRAKNMKLYHVLRWMIKNKMSFTYDTCFYYITPVSDIAPHGAIIFLEGKESSGELSTAEQLECLRQQLAPEALAPAVYLFSHRSGEMQQQEGLPITAPCHPCSANLPELLDSLPTRQLYTYHTHLFARKRLEEMAQLPYRHLCFSLSEYEGIFSPGERI